VSYASAEGLQVALADTGVLTLTLDRPDKRNALDDTMVQGLIAAVEQAGQDEAVRVISISAVGPHFCGGFDIVGRNAERGECRPRAGSIQRRLPAQAHRLIPLLLSVQTPVVCAVRGWAAGIGLHLVLAADFAVASTTAHFWEPFNQRGFTPDSGGTWLLPRRVGEVRARQMLILGRAVDGDEAAAWGMVHGCVPDDELDKSVGTLVRDLAAGPTVSLGLTKWLLHTGMSSSLHDHLSNEAFAMELSSRSEDFREGMAAFREKRDPRFSGR
jgi:2-(1,2-epoxy-1,2-dihydrophenyl)acetyl-CoA isomerase